MIVHVDDQLIAGSDEKHVMEFIKDLDKEFKCKDLGEAKRYLGMETERDMEKGLMWIGQQGYLKRLLDNFAMTDSNPRPTPLPPKFKPCKATDDEFAKAKHLPYNAIVGSILYAATITRPDLAHASSVLSQYMSKWNLEHYKAAKHVLRYIKGTTDLVLQFSSNSSDSDLYGFADADYAADLVNCRSRTGYTFNLFGNCVSWKSKLQQTTALSTQEAEYMAGSNAGKQLVWMRRVCEDLHGKWFNFDSIINNPTSLLGDNNGTISLSNDPVNHDRCKHIDTRHH